MRFLLRILFNALALYLIVYLVPGIIFRGDWQGYLLAGLILALINSLIKPILKFISLPFIALTFGLFTLFINIFILWLLVQFVDDLRISNFWAYLWGTIIISLFNFLTHPFIQKKKPKIA